MPICSRISLQTSATHLAVALAVTNLYCARQRTPMREMIERAQSLGANAIIGIDIDYGTIGEGNSMIMVTTSGTAVVI